MPRHRIAPLLLAPLLVSTSVVAQDASAETPAPDTAQAETEQRGLFARADLADPAWTIRIEPGVSFLAPAGDLKLPSSTAAGQEVELNDLGLDSPRLAPFGRAIAARGRWRFAISGLGYAASDRGAIAETAGQIGGATFSAGDRLISDLSYQSFDLTASIRMFHVEFERTADAQSNRLEAGADLVGGLRFHHADFDVNVVSPTPGAITNASADELFAEPIVGVRLEGIFFEDFGIDVESLVGGFSTGDRTSISFSIDAGFTWRPIPAVGVRIGYHMIVFDLQEGSGADEFEWRGSLAGLYWGAQISF